ncbi:hypothetical protein ELH77_19065 [Rhizobium ruizarguesonis]|uniref:hypothetical protein n=1 Tax=Rhizobium ruizarguesonis TaxID=2081791 RepID=UPI00102F9BAE|nr:hypothetical protein [Rhizobium ruizarguesonis]TAZ20707.1 hypothetical protein ELH77_19065 [Rhizobium ruizarguesonis]
MTAERWMKFFPSDWLSDPALRTCSEGARGVWIDMLCLMDGASPRGHLKLGRKNIDLPTLAGLLRIPQKRLEKYIEELRGAGVFSVTNRGVIFSRKMVREEKWRKKGEKMANARWSKATDNKGGISTSNAASMTPESRIQKRTSLPFRLDAPRDPPPNTRPAVHHHDPPDYSNDPVEPTPALLRTPIVKHMKH